MNSLFRFSYVDLSGDVYMYTIIQGCSEVYNRGNKSAVQVTSWFKGPLVTLNLCSSTCISIQSRAVPMA